MTIMLMLNSVRCSSTKNSASQPFQQAEKPRDTSLQLLAMIVTDTSLQLLAMIVTDF